MFRLPSPCTLGRLNPIRSTPLVFAAARVRNAKGQQRFTATLLPGLKPKNNPQHNKPSANVVKGVLNPIKNLNDSLI